MKQRLLDTMQSWPRTTPIPAFPYVRRLVSSLLGFMATNEDPHEVMDDLIYFLRALIQIHIRKVWPEFMKHLPHYVSSRRQNAAGHLQHGALCAIFGATLGPRGESAPPWWPVPRWRDLRAPKCLAPALRRRLAAVFCCLTRAWLLCLYLCDGVYQDVHRDSRDRRCP